jgi:hypothetical protein
MKTKSQSSLLKQTAEYSLDTNSDALNPFGVGTEEQSAFGGPIYESDQWYCGLGLH